MRYMNAAVMVFTFFASCKTPPQNTDLKQLENLNFSIYQTVNSEPQFADGDDHFLVYWAVWRQLAPAELQKMGTTLTGALISLRDIYWTVTDCSSNKPINIDGEKVWYFDELEFDQSGRLKPIKEAPRAGYRYFSMLNLNSQHLRGAGPWIGPKKQRGETVEQWDARRHKAYLEWLHRSWAKGTRGQLTLNSEHRLYEAENISTDDKWIQPKDYPYLTGEALQLVSKYAPRQWPIHFDERAHKPHSFLEPLTWRASAQPISVNKLRARLDWNWCDVNKPVVAEMFFPRGEMPPAGPNRPGRTDGGHNKIKVTEIDWPAISQ